MFRASATNWRAVNSTLTSSFTTKNLQATRTFALVVALFMEVSQVTNTSTNAVLQAAAKSLVWDLYAAAGYCRTRTFVDVEKFERELFTAARQWRAAHSNLKGQRRKYGRKKP
jgi:hypothetical protein